MNSVLIFLSLSIPVIYISRKYLRNRKTHGFYRFLAWECILTLFAINYRFWFADPFSVCQIISWILLIASFYPLIAGAILLNRTGKQKKSEREDILYEFEKTTKLVDSGIFSYIRHPLYLSLILVTWGIFFKNINLYLLPVSILSTVFLYITARFDEKECIAYFGHKYKDYIKRTSMFIPYIF